MKNKKLLIALALVLCVTLSGCGKEALVCDHPITYMVNVHDATCTTDGYLGDRICVSCGEPKQIGYWVEKYHMWDGEKCTVCGIAQPY